MKKACLIIAVLPIVLFGQTTANVTSATVIQEQSRVNAMNEVMKNNTSSQMLYYKPMELDIKGSKYLYDNYVDGELWFTNGDYVTKEYVYKFDESQNSVQIKNKKGEEILVDAVTINACKLNINGKTVIYFRGQMPNDPNTRKLFQLIYNTDTYKVIKLPSKRLIPKTKIFHDDAQQYEYLNEHTYYLKKGEGKYSELKLKKKALLEAFPDKKALLTRIFEKPAYKEKLDEAALAAILTELDLK
jgi:hypothetical protein